jgi:integrase
MSNIEIARSYHELTRQLEKLRKRFRQRNIKITELDYQAMQRFVRYLSNDWQLQTLYNYSFEHFEGYREHLLKNNKTATFINAELKAIDLFRNGITELQHRPLRCAIMELSSGKLVKREMTWSADEFRQMMDVAKKAERADFACAMGLAYFAGLRIGEYCRLNKETAENALKTGILVVKGKYEKTRTVPIDGRSRKVLENLCFLKDIPSHVFIRQMQRFISRHRNKLPPRHFTQKELTFDGLRHSFAFNKHDELTANGMKPRVARMLLAMLLGYEQGNIIEINSTSFKVES